jgi:hypothetical protein
MRLYIAGAWTEQHKRARPMISRARAAGIDITHDWTQPEVNLCSCAHLRVLHRAPTDDVGFTGCTLCGCIEFNGIGTGSDATLSSEERRAHAIDDLQGVLTADIFWLLAPDSKQGCGCWTELGAAVSARWLRNAAWPHIVVSGSKRDRSIFTELAERRFDRDGDALTWIVSEHVARSKEVLIFRHDVEEEAFAGDVGQS